jgi:hypothetical protein
MELSQINIKQASDVFTKFAVDRTLNQKKYIIIKNGQFELKELTSFDKISLFFDNLFGNKSQNSLLQQIRSGMTEVSLLGRNLDMNINKTNLLGEIPALVGKLYNHQFLKIADATFKSEQLAMVAAIVLGQRENPKEVVTNSKGQFELKNSPQSYDWKYKLKLHNQKADIGELIELFHKNFFNSEKVVCKNEILKSEHEDLKAAIDEITTTWDTTTAKDLVLAPLQERLKQIEENKLAEIQRSLDEDSQRSGATTPTASKNPEIDRLEKAKNNFEQALKIQKTLLKKKNCSSTARQPLLDSQMRMV